MIDCPDVLNLRHLRMLQIIGQVGGVTCASRMLNTSQPAVTQAILNLEGEFGVEVFERTSTGTYPTAAGSLLLARIDRFFDVLERAIGEILGQAKGQERPVERRISATQMRALIVTSSPAKVEENSARLGVAPSTLYRSVRALERELGHALFKRTADGPVCNKAGEFLAREMRRAVREIEFARGEIRVATGTGDMKILVGALPMAGSCDLAASLQQMMRQRPKARVRVVFGEYHSLLDDLRNCRIDMIYGLLRKPEWADDIEEEAFFQDTLCVAVRRNHPLTKVAEVTPELLSRYPWAVPAKGTPRREQIEKLFSNLPQKPHFGIETSSLATLRALLYDSDMVTILPRSEMALDDRTGILAGLHCRYFDPLPPKGLTTRRDWLPTEAHRDFIRFLRQSTKSSVAELRAGAHPEWAAAS